MLFDWVISHFTSFIRLLYLYNMLMLFPFIIQLTDILFTSEGSQVNDELVLSEESEDEEVSNYVVSASFSPLERLWCILIKIVT